MVIATGWALAVMAGVFTAVACGSADAHLNPAVTLGAAVTTGDFSKFGAVHSRRRWRARSRARTLVWLHFLPHWRETPEADQQAGLLLHRAGHPQARRPTC